MNKAIKNYLRKRLKTTAPHAIAQRFSTPANSGINKITQALTEHYFSHTISSDPAKITEYLNTTQGKKDLHNQTLGRLQEFRTRIVPWLDSTFGLAGTSILEIGSGTGASSVALCEQGAHLTSLDIDEASHQVAATRLGVYGQSNTRVTLDASDINTLTDQQFDCIIFFACLEHMTIQERLTSLKKAWVLLNTGGYLVVVDTPNRLAFMDNHTSRLPFYNWLPDELAFLYAGRSQRSPFNTMFKDYTQDNLLRFIREGRGVSYHEFELSIKPVKQLTIASTLEQHESKRNPLWHHGRRLFRSKNVQFETFIRSIEPTVPQCFMSPSLNFCLQK